MLCALPCRQNSLVWPLKEHHSLHNLKHKDGESWKSRPQARRYLSPVPGPVVRRGVPRPASRASATSVCRPTRRPVRRPSRFISACASKTKSEAPARGRQGRAEGSACAQRDYGAIILVGIRRNGHSPAMRPSNGPEDRGDRRQYGQRRTGRWLLPGMGPRRGCVQGLLPSRANHSETTPAGTYPSSGLGPQSPATFTGRHPRWLNLDG